MRVRLSLPSVTRCIEHSILHLSLSDLSQVSISSVSLLIALLSYFIGQTEPRILRLVGNGSSLTFNWNVINCIVSEF